MICVYVTMCSDQLFVCVFEWFYDLITYVLNDLLYVLENYIWYHWVNLWNQNTRDLLDSILLCIVYNYLLDVWPTPSITIFRLKFNWETKTLDLFVRCKVECESFLGDVNNAWSPKRFLVIFILLKILQYLEINSKLWILVL